LANLLKRGSGNWRALLSSLFEHPARDVAVRHELPKLLGIFSEEVWGGYEGLERRKCFRALRGDFGQKSLDFNVGEDDVRFPLEGLVVTPFKSISFF